MRDKIYLLLFLFFYTNIGFGQDSRIWASYFGGQGNESAFSTATDDLGYVIFAGITNSLNVIGSAGSFQKASVGGVVDAHVAICYMASGGFNHSSVRARDACFVKSDRFQNTIGGLTDAFHSVGSLVTITEAFGKIVYHSVWNNKEIQIPVPSPGNYLEMIYSKSFSIA